MAGNKKIVVLLIAVTVASCPLATFSAEPAISKESKSGENSSSLFADEDIFFVKPTEGAGSRELFFKTMLSVLLVVALGAVAIYVSKKFLPRISNLSGKEIRVIETVHLGPRKFVHLLQVGNQRFLIGSTNENVTKLADVTDTLVTSDEQESLIGNINGR
ncbi:MAG: flagellar biosynthetic protein FliO [Planctomycetota bacterium]|jgi:flagellar biosynthetic protein FliO